MIKRIIALAILIPLGIILIMLSVANRTAVTLALNPFDPSDQVLSVTLPFFVFVFVALIVGMIIGSLATWVKQGKHRKQARVQASEAVKWHSEADRQKAKAQQIAGSLPAPGQAHRGLTGRPVLRDLELAPVSAGQTGPFARTSWSRQEIAAGSTAIPVPHGGLSTRTAHS